jgi:photosystem II stability/assembly factor-like uncharacterized protein
VRHDQLIAVGDGGTILRSRRRDNWEERSQRAGPRLNDIFAVGRGELYAVGDTGTALHTTDRGATWRVEETGVTTPLRAVWASGSTDVYAVGGAGTILHSGDGRTWERQVSNTDARLGAIWGSGLNDVFVIGSSVSPMQQFSGRHGKGVVLHSSNRGSTWELRRNLEDEAPRAVWGNGPNDVYVVVSGKATTGLLHTSDGGRTWEPRDMRRWTGSVHDLCSTRRGQLLATAVVAGARSEIGLLRSTNGVTWGPLDTKISGYVFNRIRGDGRGHLWITAQTWHDFSPYPYGWTLLSSADDGETWQQPRDVPNIRDLASISVSDDGVFVVGGGGSILHYEPGE